MSCLLGRSIAISGDTASYPNITSAAKGVDVLFHEALNIEMVQTMGAADEFEGKITVSKDGTIIRLLAKSEIIKYESGL